MSILFETSFSPLLKFEEPGDTWWFDWYPCGNQKSESFLLKYRESQLEVAAFAHDVQDDTPPPAAASQAEDEKPPPSVVPCMAMDLEQEIAVLEEQARSDGHPELIPFEDDVAFMADVAESFQGIDPVNNATCGPVVTIPTRNVTRRSCKPSKEVVVAATAEAEEPNECSNQPCSTVITDVDHSSEDDNATYVSSAHKPALGAPPSAAPYTTISLTRKPARHTLKARPSATPSANIAMNESSYDSPEDAAIADGVGSWSEPGASPTLKRAGEPLPPTVKVARLGSRGNASPRSQITDGEDGDEDSGELCHGSGTAISCGSSKRSLSNVPRPAEKSAPAKRKQKGKGLKAPTAGSPRGKKRAAGRPAAPIPGVHACSQCGAQSTPVWRAGPCGPKTLCNACGVRYMKTAKKK